MLAFDYEKRLEDVEKELQNTALQKAMSNKNSLSILLSTPQKHGYNLNKYSDVESMVRDLLGLIFKTGADGSSLLGKEGSLVSYVEESLLIALQGDPEDSFNTIIEQFINVQKRYDSEKAESIMKGVMTYLSNYVGHIKNYINLIDMLKTYDVPEDKAIQDVPVATIVNLMANVFVYEYKSFLEGKLIDDKYIGEVG